MALIDVLLRELNTATLNGIRPLEWRMTRLAYRELRKLKAIDTPRADHGRRPRRAFIGIPIRLAPGMDGAEAHLHFRARR